MWLNHQITNTFRQEYAIEEKLLDVRSDHLLEIFKSKHFHAIALLNEREVLFQSLLHIQSELFAHIGACCLPLIDPNAPESNTLLPRALILGGFNLEIAFELFKHDMAIDFVQADTKVLDSFISFFPHFEQIRSTTLFSLYEKAIDLPLCKYDLILHQGTPNAHELEGLRRMLSAQGILIARVSNPYLQEQDFAQSLRDFSQGFGIVMPFFAPLAPPSMRGFIFASQKTHPLANFWLQRCDMLEDLRYYNADIHQAAFALPQILITQHKGVIKN